MNAMVNRLLLFLSVSLLNAAAQTPTPIFKAPPRLPASATTRSQTGGMSRSSHPIAQAIVQGDGYSCSLQTITNLPAIAEQITPEIVALAENLQNNPSQIYDYVHNNITYVHYFGSKKGALLTLLEGSGNDFDQCALLVALLRAASTNSGTLFPNSTASYAFGLMDMPYMAGTTNADLAHWLGLFMPLTSTNYDNVYDLMDGFNYQNGFPEYGTDLYVEPMLSTTNFAFHRVWVQFYDGTNTFCLDPAFKVSTLVPGMNIGGAMGLNVTNLLTDLSSGATVTNNYTQTLNWTKLTNDLTAYTTNLLWDLNTVHTNYSVSQVLGGGVIVPSTTPPLTPTSNPGLPFQVLNITFTNAWGTNVSIPVQYWTNIPGAYLSSLQMTVDNINTNVFFPGLLARKISLTFSNSQSVLSLDDIPLTIGSGGSGSTTTMTNRAHFPTGVWNYGGHTITDDNRLDWSDGGEIYQRNAAGYVILYGFEDPHQWLPRRQQKLQGLMAQGLTNQSSQVVTELLEIIGLNWIQQTYLERVALSAPQGVTTMFYVHGGRVAQETGSNLGYYVDLGLNRPCLAQNTIDPTNEVPFLTTYLAHSFFSSAMEDTTIEQMTTNVAVSTIKMLYLANSNGQKLILGTPANSSSVNSLLSAETIRPYDPTTRSSLVSLVGTTGNAVLLPSGTNIVGTWGGYGYLLTNSVQQASIINGGYGGYAAFQSWVDPVFANNSYANSVGAYNPGSATQSSIARGDPVSMLDGSFSVNTVDLSVGRNEPRGFVLARHYDTNRRNSNTANMGNGWTHRYILEAFQRSDAAAALGHNTPQEMAPILVGTQVAYALLNSPPTSTDPAVLQLAATALVAEWTADQLTNNAVSITMGPSDIQFIKQPDGSFTAPAGVKMTLTQPSGFALQQRHGNTFNFNAAGLCTNIVDPFNNIMLLGYTTINTTNTVLSTVSDSSSTARVLSFSYNTANPPQLTSISDGSRTVSYSYSSQNDLTNVADALGKNWSYIYDGDNKMLATLDPLARVVVTNSIFVTNNFNGFPSVAQQLSQGLTANTWNLYVAGAIGTEVDPKGGVTTFFYDAKNRLIGQKDAEGNQSILAYDGQDHLIQSVSPLNETNLFFYDGSNNIIAIVDALNFTNTFYYDGANNLIKILDSRGHAATFGYNSNFEVTGATNGAGDWRTFGYRSDGLRSRCTDAGGNTAFGYDSYGQLSEIIWPSSLAYVYFTNNTLGDVTSTLSGDGFTTAFQYNARRALTNVVGPTNLTTSLGYDAVGNLQTATDARGSVTTNVWSATRRLLAVLFPSTPQGSPTVTNVYDGRDWLVAGINPLQQTTLFTNDAAHRLLSVTDPLSRTSGFSHDNDGRVISATDPANETSTMQWSARGQMLVFTDAATNIVGRVFDGAANQVALTNRDANVWNFQFDGANRLTNVTSPLSHTLARFWNNRGLPSSIVQPSGHTTTFNYDAADRLSSRADPVATTSFQFDANNNLTNITESSVSYPRTYDAYNRIVKYVDGSGNVFQYQYDANNNLTNLIYPGGNHVNYLYDALNRLTNVVDWAGRKTSYMYDLAGHMTNMVRPNGTVRVVTYDAAGEIGSILEKTSAGNGIAYFQYTNDLSGRIQSEFIAPYPHPYSLPNRTMTFDNDDRLATVGGTSVTMDVDGNMTYGPGTNNIFGTYSYDARNRLLNGGGLSYTYDPLGNRTWMTNGATTTQFIVNPNGPLAQTLIRVEGGVTNYYVYGLGLIYHVDAAGNTSTYHYDARGSTVAITSSSGAVTDRIEYSPYGTITYRNGTTDTPFLFNGRYGVMTDPNGLLFMRARYYNPYICRFINADPSGFAGGLNMFAFANGNPVSLVDPFGLGALGEGPAPTWMSNQNSVPNIQFTVYPNVNTGPQMGPPGFVAPQPYYDPSLPTTYSAIYPTEQLASDFAKILSVGLETAFTFGASAIVSEAVIGSVFDSVAGAAEGGSETFFRTMSQEHYEQLLNTGQIPATGETFISPSLEYAQQYNGVTVLFNVQSGTTDSLLGMGVRNAGLNGGAYGNLPLVQSGWGASSAFFKLEGNVVNVGLGNGSALNTFNNSIVNFGLVPKP